MQGSGTFSVEAVFQTAIPKGGKVIFISIDANLVIPFLSPSAFFILSPKAIPTSSTVWCMSTFKSPSHFNSR